MNAYDFSAPGPNAPYPWLKRTLEKMSPMERQKILMGIPFYGYDNVGGCLTYIQSLKDNEVTKIKWDSKAHVRKLCMARKGIQSDVACCAVAFLQECQHTYTSEQTGSHHVVFFPCLQFLQDRLTLYKEHGVGVAIWELGQGMHSLLS
ncbi:unnamed protein product [Phytophthora lilii]|uniref:Unnamed protein product n=1 Tax=Phytophthora lilii TaxID=2077276 RepID=A0A9W6WV01_9STRA|nr:unnamed protein product [Phytophthora lilii]